MTTMEDIFKDLEAMGDKPVDLSSHINNIKGGKVERFEKKEGNPYTSKSLNEQFKSFGDVIYGKKH